MSNEYKIHQEELPLSDEFIAPKETLSSHLEAAQLIRDASYLIADDFTAMFDSRSKPLHTYPLHKKQILDFLKNATITDIHFLDFDTDVQYDEELSEIIICTLERIVDEVTNQRDISHLFNLFLIVSFLDREKAIFLVNQLQKKYSEGLVSGERAEDFIRQTMHLVTDDEQYLSTIENDDLISMIKDEKNGNIQANALAELMKRDNSYAIELVNQPLYYLTSLQIDVYLLREIFVQKILINDFSICSEVFLYDEDLYQRQFELAIIELKERGLKFDSLNYNFASSLLLFNDNAFFEAISSILTLRLPLHPLLLEEAEERLSNLLTQIDQIDKYIKKLVYAEKFVFHICENYPDLTFKFWDLGIESLKIFLEQPLDNFYSEVFIRSFLRGFSLVIYQDLSRYHEIEQCFKKKDDDNWLKIRGELFWQLVIINPERIEEYLKLIFGGIEQITSSDSNSLIYSLEGSISNVEKKQLMAFPGVQWFFKQMVSEKKFSGNPFLSKKVLNLANLAGVSELSDDLNEDLIKLDYSLDESQFINFFLPGLLNHQPDEIQEKLSRFHQIKAWCKDQNYEKAVNFQFNRTQEELFWLNSQVWVAAILEVSPNILDQIINRDMGHTHGYNRLKENLGIFGRVAYLTQSEDFLEIFYKVTNGIPPAKLWEFIVHNYNISDIVKMSTEEMLQIKHFLNGIGNLNLAHLFKVLKRIYKGEIPQEAADLGVTEAGSNGANQLRELIFNTINQLLLDPKYVIDPENPLQLEILREISRVEVTAFRRENFPLAKIVKKINYVEQLGLLDLRQGYFQKDVSILVPDEKDGEFEYSSESIARFQDLQSDVIWVFEEQNYERLLSISIENLLSFLKNKLHKMDAAIAKNPAMSQKIEDKMKLISELIMDISEVVSPRQLISKLVLIKKLFKNEAIVDQLLRRNVLSLFLDSNKYLSGKLRELAQSTPSSSNLLALSEFFESNLSAKFIIRNFSDKNERAVIKDVFGVKGITDELERKRIFLEQKSKKLKFVPNRGLLGELSGHIADACWNIEEDIMMNYLNVTPVIIVTNPDNPRTIRAGGAFLLLEVQESLTGDSVLVIRGNNPLETLIGSLDVVDYVKKVVSYAQEIAQQRGISKVALPMDERGASGTNRQSVRDAYDLMFGSNKIIHLSRNATFNGYSLYGNCVVV